MKLKSKPSLPEDEFKDLGFGTKISAQSKRLINKDGTFNVERRGLPFLESLSFYHWLLEMSWLKFNGFVLLVYVVVNLFFASLYMLIGVEAQIMLTMKESSSGKALRKYYPLTLERNRVNFLPLTWTIVHPIDEGSPLNDLTPDDLKEAKAEFLILIKAYDETFSQSVHSRSSYTTEEIIWNARFSNIYDESSGVTVADMRKFNEIEKVQV